MNEEYDNIRDTYVVRDSQNIVRQVLHNHQPFTTGAKTIQEAIRSYLSKYQNLFGINSEQLKNLELSPEENHITKGELPRLLGIGIKRN